MCSISQWACSFSHCAGASRKPAKNSDRKEFPVDYLIAGICAVLLFAYLIYALLKPERF